MIEFVGGFFLLTFGMFGIVALLGGPAILLTLWLKGLEAKRKCKAS